MASPTATISVALSPRARGRAVTYAEELGLNDLWKEGKAACEALGILYHQRAQHNADLRELKATLLRREIEITEAIRKDTPDIAEAKLQRELKLLTFRDEVWSIVTERTRTQQEELATIEAEIASEEMTAKTTQARMRHLGGYFSYLAASKEALTIDKFMGQIP